MPLYNILGCIKKGIGLLYLLFEMVSLEAVLANPLTPAVLAGSILLLFDCVLNLPQVLGFKLAKNEDFGDCVAVGLFAEIIEQKLKQEKNKTNTENQLSQKSARVSGT